MFHGDLAPYAKILKKKKEATIEIKSQKNKKQKKINQRVPRPPKNKKKYGNSDRRGTTKVTLIAVPS